MVPRRASALGISAAVLLTLGCLAAGCELIAESSSPRSLPQPLRHRQPQVSPRVNQRSLPAPPCTEAALGRATAQMQGATGEMIGSLEITDISSHGCSLRGVPRLTIFSARGNRIPLHQQPDHGFLRQMNYPRWRGYPVVSLRPGQRAVVLLRWRNCGHPPALSSIRVAWHGRTWSARLRQGAICNPLARLPSILEVSRFTPRWH
jgi:hypothetical protein